METQRASLSLGRWSLWLLLLGLVLPSASAQALSYREAVLRAVDRINDGSSEANLYRLLELDPPPKDVSWGGGWGQALLLPALATLSLLSLRLYLCQEGTFPSRWAPTSSRKPSQTWGPPSTRLPVLASLLWEQVPCTPGSGSLDFWELQGWGGGHRLCEVTSLLMSSLHLGVSLPGRPLSAWRLQ